MNNPTTATLTKGAWRKVATAVTNGSVVINDPKEIDLLKNQVRYTYRVTGDPAPTLLTPEGVIMTSKVLNVKVDAAIDVYLWPETTDIVVACHF